MNQFINLKAEQDMLANTAGNLPCQCRCLLQELVPLFRLHACDHCILCKPWFHPRYALCESQVHHVLSDLHSLTAVKIASMCVRMTEFNVCEVNELSTVHQGTDNLEPWSNAHLWIQGVLKFTHLFCLLCIYAQACLSICLSGFVKADQIRLWVDVSCLTMIEIALQYSKNAERMKIPAEAQICVPVSQTFENEGGVDYMHTTATGSHVDFTCLLQ